jgi:hypothetical protein
VLVSRDSPFLFRPLFPGRFNRANIVLDVRAKTHVSWDEVRAFVHAVPRGREYLVAAREAYEAYRLAVRSR